MKRVTKRFARIGAIIMAAAMMLTSVPVQEVQAASGDSGSKAPYRNVMYYGDWSIWGGQGNFYPKDIPADQITHLNFAFLYFDKDGNLKFTDKDAATGAPVGMNVTWGAANGGILNAFQILRAENPNLKIGVSIGGWSKSNEFSRMSASDTARANFVSNVMKFVEYTNMDFVDIDWEYPGEHQYREPDKVDNTNDEGTIYASAEDKANYIKLMQDLRNALDKQGKEIGKTYELSCALPAPSTKLEDGIDIKRLFEIIDFGNMMTYDMRGAWDSVSGHQTPLYGNPADPYYESGLSVDQTVKYLLSKGAPAEKIVIGCAFYTRGWNQVEKEGTVPGMPGLFGNAAQNFKDADQTPSYGAVNEAPMKVGEGGRAGGVWSYNALETLKGRYSGMQEYWDDVAKAPYMYDEKTGTFFTYDNVKSVTLKAEYVKANGLGGCISWMASQDKKTDSTKRDELTKAIKKGLYGSTPLTQYEIVAPKIDVTANVKMFSENWGAMNCGYEITLKNNEKANESGEVLQLTELAYETIKSPKLYITLKDADTLSPSGYGCGTVTNKGKVVEVDLATVYDNQTIGQGASVIFNLACANKEASIDNIVKIELAQRITADGPEIGRQIIYGEDTDSVEPTESTEESTEPTESTEESTEPTESTEESTEPTESTEESTEPTESTEESTEPTESTEESTEPTESTEESTEPSEPVEGTWDPNKAYNSGDTVTYKGKTYQAKWWTQGDTPGASEWGPWKLIGDATDPTNPVEPTDPVDPIDPAVPAWDASTVYNSGDMVSYQGQTYKAQWWNQGEVPGSSEWGAWILVK